MRILGAQEITLTIKYNRQTLNGTMTDRVELAKWTVIQLRSTTTLRLLLCPIELFAFINERLIQLAQ